MIDEVAARPQHLAERGSRRASGCAPRRRLCRDQLAHRGHRPRSASSSAASAWPARPRRQPVATPARASERRRRLVAQRLEERALVQRAERLRRERRIVDGRQRPVHLGRALAEQPRHVKVRADRSPRRVRRLWLRAASSSRPRTSRRAPAPASPSPRHARRSRRADRACSSHTSPSLGTYCCSDPERRGSPVLVR